VHLDLGAKLAEVVHQVVGEAVVIIDEQNAGHGAVLVARFVGRSARAVKVGAKTQVYVAG
jgi:hypothetical protein